MIDERTRALWMVIRQALLLAVDGIERYLDMEPRTADLRKGQKGQPEGSAGG
jgi:hypothetical protein